MAGMYGRDNQRSAVYRWQVAYSNAQSTTECVTIEQARRLVLKVWVEQSRSGRDAPRVVCGHARRNTNSAWYRSAEHKLCLQREGFKRTVLHELAHALVRDEPCFACVQSHGREFMYVYIRLCALYLGWDEADATLNARRSGVGVASIEDMQHRKEIAA